MAEKPRAPRQANAVGTIATRRQLAGRLNSHSHEDPGAEVKDQLAKLQEELEKSRKISRSLARNYARAEQEIRRLQETISLLMDYGSNLFLRFNRQGKILEASAACQSLLGVSPESVKGQLFPDLIVSDEQRGVRRFFEALVRDNDSKRIVVHQKKSSSDGTPLELVCQAVPHPQTQTPEIICLARPVPSNVQAVVVKDTLADSLAHELNQPLTALAIGARACSQLARARHVDMDELVQTIDQLALQAERAGELVRRMRQMASGANKSGWKESAIIDLVQNALVICRPGLERARIAVELHIPPDLPKIKMDQIQLEQVLANLIRNAVEAMEEVPPAERVLILAASRQSDEVVIVVTDTGRGLSPAIAERLFQPYQTTKAQGMGLGLAISRAIVQAHAGRLWVEEARGPGATFCLSLPIGT